MAKRKRDDDVLKTLHVEGVTYQLKRIRCGKEKCRRCPHGPYWYATRWNAERSKTKTVYVGKELPRVDEMLARPEFADE